MMPTAGENQEGSAGRGLRTHVECGRPRPFDRCFIQADAEEDRPESGGGPETGGLCFPS